MHVRSAPPENVTPGDLVSENPLPAAHGCNHHPAGDQKLVQIVNAALADSARRSGKWLACKPGCSQCCVGVFAISQLDVLRLQRGITEMDVKEPEKAARIRARARDVVARLS